jgi:hypothetical protein
MSLPATDGATQVVEPKPAETEAAKPETKTEAAAAPTETKPEEKVDASRELAILHRERKKLREQEKANAERLKKLEAYEAKLAKAKEDPESFLVEAGLTLDEIVQWKLKQGEPLTPEEQAKAIESKVNKTVEERIKEHEEKKAKEAEQIRMKEDIDAFRASVVKAVESNSEQYELISVYDQIDTAMAICAQAIQEDPDAYQTREDAEKLIPRVLDMLEAQLLEEQKEKLGRAKKLKSIFSAPVEEPKKDISPEATATPAPQPTLTNSMNSPASPVTEKPGALLSREESLKRLAAKLAAANPEKWGSAS